MGKNDKKSTLQSRKAALGYIDAGLPIVLAEGKRPIGQAWKNRQWTEAEIEREFDLHPDRNVGLILGPASGIVDIECDTPEAETELAEIFKAAGEELPIFPTWTSKRGKHRLAAWHDDLPPKAAIHLPGGLEIRMGANGKAAQSIMPPSVGDDGLPREWLPRLSIDDVAPPEIPKCLLDAIAAAGKPGKKASKKTSDADGGQRGAPHVGRGDRPGDRFSREAAWEDILSPHGWTNAGTIGDTIKWRRPGKEDDGHSATSGFCRGENGDDKLYVFSSNAGPFEPEKTYSRFEAFVVLNHAGDFSEGAKWLLKNGFASIDFGPPPVFDRNGNTIGPGDFDPDDVLADGNEVVISPNEERVANEAIRFLADRPDVYQRAGRLCHILRDANTPRGAGRPGNTPRIAEMKEAKLREVLSSCVRWIQMKKSDEGPVKAVTHPPGWAVKAILCRGQWGGIRPIESVLESPTMRPDGSVLQTPGYDAATASFYAPQIDFPKVAAMVAKTDAQRAAAALLDVVTDFPFNKSEHRSAWLASLLTPFCRSSFAGPSPLFAVDANVRGSGKSLLTDCVSAIVSGRDFARMTAPKEDEEARKRITAIAIAGEPLVLVDNVHGSLGSSALDAAITSTSWSDRILGKSEMMTVPLNVTWFATGNNILLSADTARRVGHIRLESPEEKPEERSGFRHPDLLRTRP